MPKPATRRRTLWISDDLWGRIERASKSDDRTVSAWVRQVIVSALAVATRKK